MAAVVIRKIAQNPHPWMVHFNNSGDPFRCAEPQNGDSHGIGNQVAVERNDFKGVAWQRKAPNFRRAAVQDMKENPLAIFYAYRFAVTKHAAVYGKELVTHFVSMRHSFGQGSFHCHFAGLFERFVRCGWCEEILSHIATATERRFELFQNQKDFAIVAARILFWLDVNGSDLPAVLTR